MIKGKSGMRGREGVMKERKEWYLGVEKEEGWLGKWIVEEEKEWGGNV